MAYLFTSILATEMDNYIELLRAANRHIEKIKSSLKSLDIYLNEHNYKNKELSEDILSSWIISKKVKNTTKAAMLSDVKGFVRYLTAFGIKAVMPEFPILKSGYVPYVFSHDEIMRMLSVADNFGFGTIRPIRAAKAFPVLIRILYGCGLRLGEGLFLRWEDIDIENGIISIRKGKNMKQRLVPMSGSLAQIIEQYKKKVQYEDICKDYLFESNYVHGKPFKNNSFYDWFVKVLNGASISYSKQTRTERGPCPHCLRHTFVLHSFWKSENEGRKFEDTSAYLSAYLGHESTKDTDKYLRASHTVYTTSHQRMDDYIGNLIPKIDFNEDE